MIDNCRPSAVVTSKRLAPVLAEALAASQTQPRAIVAGDTTIPDALDFGTLLETQATPVTHGGIDADLAMLIYTSGSTGRPKGVMMTHRNIEAASLSIMTYLGAREDDVVMNVLPLAFDYGLYQLLMAVRAGATLVLEKSFAF